MAMILPIWRHKHCNSSDLPHRRRTGYNCTVLQAAPGAIHAAAAQNETGL
jgi:hypothetical protein